jgi:alginate O-acetyltransferase complex protein AlgI
LLKHAVHLGFVAKPPSATSAIDRCLSQHLFCNADPHGKPIVFGFDAAAGRCRDSKADCPLISRSASAAAGRKSRPEAAKTSNSSVNAHWVPTPLGCYTLERAGIDFDQILGGGMTFVSWQFGVLVAVVFVIYYLPSLRAYQVPLLVLASLFFYGYGQPELLPLLAIAVFGTYLFLILSMANRVIWLPAGIAFNLALLAFFKYKLLFINPLSPPLSDVPVLDFLLLLPLPIGISFFVFHNISLLVDLTSRAEKKPPDLASVFLYIIFFPQLVSGPITQAANFMPQIRPKVLAEVQFVDAAKWILTGYFFKLYVANNLNTMTAYMDFPFYETVQAHDKWTLVFLYGYQIYADFFGYSSIAIGLGLLFGYRLPINFNLPYISASFSEFWTRWHISLSSWLRTYLYIPLGGNRRGELRTYLNLMIVMGLGGLWHGAGLSYLTWGLLHGCLLVIERPMIGFLNLANSSILRGARISIVFLCVSLLWIFFKLPNFTHATAYLAGMFHHNDSPKPVHLSYALATFYALPVMIQHLVPHAALDRFIMRAEPYLYGMMAVLLVADAGPNAAFIYFQF